MARQQALQFLPQRPRKELGCLQIAQGHDGRNIRHLLITITYLSSCKRKMTGWLSQSPILAFNSPQPGL